MKSNVPRQCLFTFEVVLLCADWVNLTAQLRESHGGIGGGIQLPEMYLQASEPPGELACRLPADMIFDQSVGMHPCILHSL